MDGVKKSGAGLSYKHQLAKSLDLELAGEIWSDKTGTDYRATGGLTWRW